MICLEELKKTTDLLSLVEKETKLRRVAITEGGEFAGPCPFCGGRDRFHVQPNRPEGGRWLCRTCTDGKWQDAISYIQRRDQCDFKTAVSTLGGGKIQTTVKKKPHPSVPPYNAPGDAWQAMAIRIIAQAEETLWNPQGTVALDYLRGRGLREETIRRFRLGYSFGSWKEVEGKRIRIAPGVTIPCMARQRVWYIKVRTLPSLCYQCPKCKAERDGPGPCGTPGCGGEVPRYLAVSGSMTASLFNAPALLKVPVGLLLEGEFDVMIATQELADLGIGVATMGSASGRPNLGIWGAYLAAPSLLLAAYDNDEAGQRGMEGLARIVPKVRRINPPPAKDINDFFLAGGNLRAWIAPFLSQTLPSVLEPPVNQAITTNRRRPLELPPLLLDPITAAAVAEERAKRTTWAMDRDAYRQRLQEDLKDHLARWHDLEEEGRQLPASQLYPGDRRERQKRAEALACLIAALYWELKQ